MSWRRRIGWLVLFTAALWTAAPASACLQSAQLPGVLPCCQSMAQMCAPAGMAADGSCCQIKGATPAIALGEIFSFEHGLKLALNSHPAGLHTPPVAGAHSWIAFEATPPISPPGSTFILRI